MPRKCASPVSRIAQPSSAASASSSESCTSSTAPASLRNRWRMDPVNLVPVGHGIVERIAARLRESGLLPVYREQDVGLALC